MIYDGHIMLANRSIPQSTVIPVLTYPNPGAAAEWLCQAFGFTVRLRIGNHRIQLNVGDGSVIIREGNSPAGNGHAVLVRVEDADSHCTRARHHGARILTEPTSQPYGERQYDAEDFAGHSWTFSQSIADVAPEQWGGMPVQL
jgi:uncharacterized glyoxalase superfamily protein PhnB